MLPLNIDSERLEKFSLGDKDIGNSSTPSRVLKINLERSLFERSVYDKSVPKAKVSPKILVEKSVHQRWWHEKITLLRSPRNCVAGNTAPEKSALIPCGRIVLLAQAITNFVLFSTFELERSKLNKRAYDKSVFSKFALLMQSYWLGISCIGCKSYSLDAAQEILAPVRIVPLRLVLLWKKLSFIVTTDA